MKRYSLVTSYQMGEPWNEIEESDTGEYVAWQDHDDAVFTLRAEVERLTERNEKLEAVRDAVQRWMNHDPTVDMSHVSDAMDACPPKEDKQP